MRSILEEFYDFVLFLLGIGGLTFFFIFYWGTSYKQRYAESIVQAFFSNTSAEGGFTREDYEGLVTQVKKLDDRLSIQLTAELYEKEPVYVNLPVEELDTYFRKRNIRKEITLHRQLPAFWEEGEPPEKLQEESNATILAETAGAALPLPGEGESVNVTAVRPQQIVYEGEELITLCRVTSTEGTYYTAAVPVRAEKTEKVQLVVYLGDRIYKTEVDVICVPKSLECENGHSYWNTRERVKDFLASGDAAGCPACKKTPIQLSVEGGLITIPVGTKLLDFIDKVEVTYLDGHTEYIRPEGEGWQDDYDYNYCGLQTVRIYYYDAVTYCTVLTQGNLCKQCLFPCADRCHNDYKDFPYCSFCMSAQYMFSGKVVETVTVWKQERMLASVEKQGFFMMRKNDRLTAAVYYRGRLLSVLEQYMENNGRMRKEQ